MRSYDALARELAVEEFGRDATVRYQRGGCCVVADAVDDAMVMLWTAGGAKDLYEELSEHKRNRLAKAKGEST